MEVSYKQEELICDCVLSRHTQHHDHRCVFLCLETVMILCGDTTIQLVFLPCLLMATDVCVVRRRQWMLVYRLSVSCLTSPWRKLSLKV